MLRQRLRRLNPLRGAFSPARAFILALTLAWMVAGLPASGGDATPTGEAEEVEAVEPAVVSEAAIRAAIDRGIRFLVADQNPDGSWGSARLTKGLNIYAPVPGAHRAFRAAVTAMCVSALIETGAAERDEETALALESGELWLLEHLPHVRRATADAIYNVWTHAYGIQALARMHERHDRPEDEDFRARIREVIATQIDLLTRYESVDGGWGYYDFRAGAKQPSSSAISFTTATCLDALRDAQELADVVPPERLVRRALDSIERQRKSDGSFLYGEYLRKSPLHPVNRPGGSLGRTMACYLALRRWEDSVAGGEASGEVSAPVSDDDIVEWMQKLFDRNGWLDIGRKRPVPHESWFAVAGYFFYYGHYYAARCLDLLPDENAAPFAERLAGVLLELQETDGSWFDFPFYDYHRQYGTAFALMALQQSLPAKPAPSDSASR